MALRSVNCNQGDSHNDLTSSTPGGSASADVTVLWDDTNDVDAVVLALTKVAENIAAKGLAGF